MQLAIPFPNISPELFSFEIGGMELALRWYALAYIAGILIAWRIVLKAVRKPALWTESGAPMTAEQVEALVTWMILGIVLGGRIGYALFYQPGYYLSRPQEILMVWQGGMSFHGGMLGVAAALWLFCRRHSIAVTGALDLLALAAPQGLFLGRTANFINAELWGRPTEMPWGVIFPGAAAQDCPGVEGLCARHPSQLYEAGLEGLILGAVMFWLAYRRGWLKTPLALTGAFLTGYGLARFVVEFVRQPDALFVAPGNPLGLAWQVGGYGLTMGQILSLPMIALGLWFVRRGRGSGARAPA